MLKTGESPGRAALMAALRASAGLGASDEAPRLADGRRYAALSKQTAQTLLLFGPTRRR
jgi:hypothetical protein